VLATMTSPRSSALAAQPGEPAPRKPATPVTIAVIAVCVLIFLALHSTGSAPRGLESALFPSAVQIWRGAAWGLVTCAFVHYQVLHLVFNMWWARDFGRLIEPDMGPWRYVAFLLTTAAVASAWQLLITDQTGIGFSGVVYAMFGYGLARRRSRPAYAAFVTSSTIRWLLGWLVLCIVLTVTDVWKVGNAAHVAGLASGWLLGAGIETKKPRLRLAAAAGGVVLAAGLVLSLAYMPWSEQWRARDASLMGSAAPQARSSRTAVP
jgi:membrane associated rhomboid family serine protease